VVARDEANLLFSKKNKKKYSLLISKNLSPLPFVEFHSCFKGFFSIFKIIEASFIGLLKQGIHEKRKA
jgi:hypothetical protein